MKILILLILVSNCICPIFECEWTHEYLCGDKCLGLRNTCTCGNETLGVTDFNYSDYTCCNKGTCIFLNLSGDVKCDGVMQNWTVPCNGLCKQTPIFGWPTLPCKDQKQCVRGITLCRGFPNCNE